MLGISRWRWLADLDPYWAPPKGASAGLDLRSLPAQAIAGGQGGWSLFEFAVDPMDGKTIILGEAKDAFAGKAQIAVLATFGFNVNAATVGDAVYELLTTHADPTGQC